MRLVELQTEWDSTAACTAIGRSAVDPNLRGWAALLPSEPRLLHEGLRQSGVAVLRGERGGLALGSLSQLWSAARSLADALEDGRARALLAELQTRAGHVEGARPRWRLPRSRLPEGRVLVMAILNVTPDSFSDGGKYAAPDAAIEHGLRLAAEGADLIDVGGESTRPGSQPVPADEELRRTLPVVRELARRSGVPISIDTTKSEVARAAVDAGAEVVNDVSGLQRDPALAGIAAREDAALCLMHSRGTPQKMQQRASYADLLGEVHDELQEALRRALEGGVPVEAIALDPGLGFAKTAAHNLLLLRRLRELTQLGRPVLLGASRKSFLGGLSGKPAAERLTGSIAAATVAALHGAALVRVHDVAATREALAVVDAVSSSSS